MDHKLKRHKVARAVLIVFGEWATALAVILTLMVAIVSLVIYWKISAPLFLLLAFVCSVIDKLREL
jgi:hypothetical protein